MAIRDGRDFHFDLKDATVPFTLAEPLSRPHLRDTHLARPLVTADFNKPQHPVILEASSIREWLEQIDFNDHEYNAYYCDVPFSQQERSFFLPPKVTPLSNLTRRMIAAAEEVSSPTRLLSLRLTACIDVVSWNESLLTRSWHIDEDSFYDPEENDFEPYIDEGHQENRIHIATAFPFTTEFHSVLIGAKTPRERHSEDGPFIIRPPRDVIYGWSDAQAHGSPLMPASRKECLELLKDEDPAFVRRLVTNKGVVRAFVSLEVGRYHPDLDYSSLATPSP